MAKGWVKRWTTSGKDHRRNDLRILRISPRTSSKAVEWRLPPSKSHLIRALALYSQTTQSITLENVAASGDDVRAMRNCLAQMGVKFEDYDSNGELLVQTNPMELGPHPHSEKWVMHGVGVNGFSRPASVLNAANSGTALRFLAGLVASIEGPIMLDGDQSLRKRDSEALWDSLRQAGVEVSIGQGSERLPVILSGPWDAEKLESGITLDISQSSQPLSSWILASTSLPVQTTLTLKGKGVSNRHSNLTAEMVRHAGCSVDIGREECSMGPWSVSGEDSYSVPGDASMSSFAVLAAFCLSSEIQLKGWPERENAIGHEILQESAIEYGIKWSPGCLKLSGGADFTHLDVTDSNDILPPMAALLALGGGGKITGAAHAAHKESNRLTRTVELLEHFGLKAELLSDGIEVEGNQVPKKPSVPVPTFEDHRLFMTAVLLASKTGGEIIGQKLHHVADEGFIQRLQDAGIGIESVQIPSLED
ncbi:hypothetical protein OAP41_01795 [Candidatus Poseidoniaceae archaeon]|nr:hypothetical protein [Candidatus Poseidoniaceae archaeon]